VARGRIVQTKKTTIRRDTRLESEGAEFLVLGSLLAEGIPAWKAYTNFPGFDIAAGSVGKGTCRIQVKSAFLTGSRTFQIKNFDNQLGSTYLRGTAPDDGS
jgi:hypothetical protein